MLAARPFAHINHKTPGRENAGGRGGVGPGTAGKARQQAGQQGAAQTGKDILLKTGPRPQHARPLGDKTPFTNHPSTRFVTPLPAKGDEKIAKLNLALAENNQQQPITQLQAPDSVLRPSSARRKSRTPRISAGALVPVGPPASFVTPLNSGRHWEVSEGDLLGLPVAEETQTDESEAEKDDFDELEYVPPSLDIPYVPPLDFTLPDYAAAGKALVERMQTRPMVFDDEPPLQELEVSAESLACVVDLPENRMDVGWDLDDPFLVPTVVAANKPKPKPVSRTAAMGTTKSTSTTATMRTTAKPTIATKSTPAPVQRPTSVRPASTRPGSSTTRPATHVRAASGSRVNPPPSRLRSATVLGGRPRSVVGEFAPIAVVGDVGHALPDDDFMFDV
ncbi:hypothetical protein HMN09_01288800 [Mycena chlorophos]|uniref:Uncharacterized protein n=1 Tax=Mycena chlorophos TaxID=658473 RepID=A0A8H6S0F2_MYCCL|nr:hypothetical protein HMN09_01288800 [Mycena chlorophos]